MMHTLKGPGNGRRGRRVVWRAPRVMITRVTRQILTRVTATGYGSPVRPCLSTRAGAGVESPQLYTFVCVSLSHARVRELEKELANVRRESTNPGMKNRILQLEKGNAKLQRELDDTRQKQKDGCVLREALQVKCIQLEAQLKDSAGMAAKALRERFEAKTVDFFLVRWKRCVRRPTKHKMVKRKVSPDGLYVVKTPQTSTELRAAHDALAARAERYVLLKTKYNKIKEDKTALRGALAEHDAQIWLLQVFQLSFFNFPLQMASLNVSITHKFIDQKKNGGGASEARLPQILHLYFFNFPQQTTKVIAKYTDYMSKLPMPDQPPPSPPSELDPICYKFLNHILPRRLVSVSDFSYLAYGPTYRYECVTKTRRHSGVVASAKLSSLKIGVAGPVAVHTRCSPLQKQEVGDIADQLKKLIWKEDGTTDDHILIPALDGTTVETPVNTGNFILVTDGEKLFM
ncbi:hypothetical protein B0H14DRAFT_2572555 [Mycena olivaceomarginata]|nr:hypothetical protein B0H14DRAFT_2572555 [Mycena olivaceomarginata]